MSDIDEIHSAINHVDPHEREMWLKIGAALKDELGDDGFAIWDRWSQQSESYQPRAARDVWKSLKPGFVRINSLFHEARQNGYAPSKPYVPPGPAEQARRAAETAQRRVEEQRNTEAVQAKAKQTAQRLWGRNGAAHANHPYLLAKGITAADIISQIKQSHYQGQHNLLIPVRQNNEIVSMQFIGPDGGKRFLAGGALRGSHTFVGDPGQMANGVVLAEGFATAASIYQATGLPVVVTFNAGNLPIVAEKLAQTLPADIAVTIAADNDVSGTGIQKAQEAAAFLGERARVVMPQFSAEQIERYQAEYGRVDADGKIRLPSDFNDLQQLAGAAAVQAQMMPVMTQVNEPQPSFAQQLAALRLPEDIAIHTETLAGGREIARVTLAGYDDEVMVDKLDTGTVQAEGGYLAHFQGRQLMLSHLPSLMTEMTARLRSAQAWEVEPPQPEADAEAAWPKSERSAWSDFPPVLRNGDLGALKAEPEYQAAKSGDPQAALILVSRLISHEAVGQVRDLIGQRAPIIVPVIAVETAGNNQIPLAMANAFGQELGLPVEYGIQQANKVSRTGAGIDHRLAFQPSFTGDVEPGREYLIMDDTLSVGSTIAALKGHIENRGGKVIGAAVMTAHEGALNIVIKPSMMDAIQHKHGDRMDDYWKEEFGYGIDKLTQGEAGHLRKAPDVEHIRDRIAAARDQAQSRMDGGQLHKEIPVRANPPEINPQEAAHQAASVFPEPPSVPQPTTDSPQQAADLAALLHPEPANMSATEITATANSIEYDDTRHPDLPFQAAPETVSEPPVEPTAASVTPAPETAVRYHESLFRHFELDDAGSRNAYATAVDAQAAADERGMDRYIGQTLDGERVAFHKSAEAWETPVAEPVTAQTASAADRTADTAAGTDYAERPDTLSPPPERTAPVTDLKYKAPPDGIAHRYICANGQYLAAENGTTVMFTDSGKKISTAKTDAQTVKDMLEVAKAKGWDSIKLSGSPEFKSMMYVAAESQGIRTRGYTPTPADLALVEKLRAEQSLNSIEAAMPQPVHTTAPTAAPVQPATAAAQAAKPTAEATATAQTDAPVAVAGERIIAHGAAPYQNQPDKQMSYFVRLEANGRERTVWGAGLPDALRQSGADVGDRIELHNLGKQLVEIEVPVHNSDGKVVGHEQKSVTRNVWQMDVVTPQTAMRPEAAPATEADKDREPSADTVAEQPDRAALSVADRMVAQSQLPDAGQVNVSVRADNDVDIPLQSIGDNSVPAGVAKSAGELKTAALDVSFQAAKDNYMAKAEKLSKSAKAKLAFYERNTLDVIRDVQGDTRTEALRNFYENTAQRMRGSKLDLPHPMQIPSPEQAPAAARDAGRSTLAQSTATQSGRGQQEQQDEPEMDR